MSRNVAIIGGSMTKFGRRDVWVDELLVQAAEECLADAEVTPDEVHQLYVSNMSGAFAGQTGVMNGLAHDIGVVPAYAQRVEQTSATGGAGIYTAYQSIAAGTSDMSLLVGGEKMTHLSTPAATDIIAGITHPHEYKHGVTLPSFAGLTARKYLERFDAPRTSLAEVAVKNHRHGMDNPNAQFQKEIDVETVLESRIIADPLRLYDFCPISDGSAALLFTTEERARELPTDYVLVSGVGGATDTHVVHERSDLTVLSGVVESSRQAYQMAGTGPEALDVAELHDMFTILEFIQMECLGLAEHGEAWKMVSNGETTREGTMPVNTSGGLKSKGHPIGASGVAQAVELYEQILGTAGPRQVEADTGLACSLGGFGNCVTTTILEASG